MKKVLVAIQAGVVARFQFISYTVFSVVNVIMQSLTCHNNVTWNCLVLVLFLTTCLLCVLAMGYGLFFGLAVTWLRPAQYGVNRFTP